MFNKTKQYINQWAKEVTDAAYQILNGPSNEWQSKAETFDRR